MLSTIINTLINQTGQDYAPCELRQPGSSSISRFDSSTTLGAEGFPSVTGVYQFRLASWGTRPVSGTTVTGRTADKAKGTETREEENNHKSDKIRDGCTYLEPTQSRV
jgi:hypothetical protein